MSTKTITDYFKAPLSESEGEIDDESKSESEEAPAPKRQKVKKKRKKQEKGLKVDLSSGTGIGKFVRRNSLGLWRTVPGFPDSVLIVSSLGYVRGRRPAGKGLEPANGGHQRKNGYRSKGADGNMYGVHRLILRAFHGPCPPGMTGDHIAKYGGDFMRERSDNRASNLRWATGKEQNVNQKKRKALRTGKPIRVRRDGTNDWTHYPSAKAADAACGVNGLGRAANPDKSTTYLKDKEGHKWRAEWAAPLESQADLPADPGYVDNKGDPKPQPVEGWRDAIYSTGEQLKGWRVSNRGRAQARHPSGPGWGDRFTPRPPDGKVYALICGSRQFHIAVFFSFGGTLNEGETVDHIDIDCSNNLRSNLHAATRSEQNLNKKMKPVGERCNSRKDRIGARHLDWPANTPTREFESQGDAARGLGVDNSNISANIRKARHKKGPQKGQLTTPHVAGHVFHNIVAPTPWEDDWGEVGDPWQRVRDHVFKK